MFAFFCIFMFLPFFTFLSDVLPFILHLFQMCFHSFANFAMPAFEQDFHLPAFGQDFHLPAFEQDFHLPAFGQDFHLPAFGQDFHLPAFGRTSICLHLDRTSICLPLDRTSIYTYLSIQYFSSTHTLSPVFPSWHS